MPPTSAGILMFRRRGDHGGAMEVLLAHPGGPYWAGKEEGAWTIPKGLARPGEALLDAAKREFAEETGLRPWEEAGRGGLIPLGSVRLRSGKTVHAWAVEGDCDAGAVRSNTCPIEWPPRSGKWIEIPEIDRAEWVRVETARGRINPAQAEFLGRLVSAVEAGRR